METKNGIKRILKGFIVGFTAFAVGASSLISKNPSSDVLIENTRYEGSTADLAVSGTTDIPVDALTDAVLEETYAEQEIAIEEVVTADTEPVSIDDTATVSTEDSVKTDIAVADAISEVDTAVSADSDTVVISPEDDTTDWNDIDTICGEDVEAVFDDTAILTPYMELYGYETSDEENIDKDIYVSVVDMGADGTDELDDTIAFLAAFSLAKNNDGFVTITIPEGTYYLSAKISVYSNTYVIADGATIIANIPSGSMIAGAHTDESGEICGYESCTHGGYTQLSNVTISGGNWDRNSEPEQNTTLLMFVHGENITIENASFSNSTNHTVNVSGCKNVKIVNCTIKDAIKYTGADEKFWAGKVQGDDSRYLSIEALHLDFLTEIGESHAYPIDATPVSSVLVSDCTFSNVFSGIGTHHITEGKASDVYIQNNTFTDMLYAGILGTSVDNLNINENTFESTEEDTDSMFAIIRDSDVSLRDNVINNAKKAIQIMAYSNAVIEGNTITNISNHGINIRDDSTAVIKGNALCDVAASSIKIFEGGTGVIDGNEVTRAGTYAVAVSDVSDVEITNNIIKDAVKYGIFVSGAVDTRISANDISGAGKAAILLDKGSVTRVEKNIITSPGQQGVLLRARSSSVITTNEIYDSSGTGVTVSSESSFKIYGNTIMRTAQYAVWIDGSIGAVKKNIIDTADAGIAISNNLYLDTDMTDYAYTLSGGIETTFINDNEIKNITGNSVYIGSYARAYLLANTLDIAGESGVYVCDSSNVVLKNNTISGALGDGITVTGNSTASISGNTVGLVEGSGIYAGDAYYLSIISNTITSACEMGIYLNAYKQSKILTNSVVSDGHGIYVEGGEDHFTQAVIRGNDSRPQVSGYAIIILPTTYDCAVEDNIMGGAGFSADEETVYTEGQNIMICEQPEISNLANVVAGIKITWDSVSEDEVLYRIYRKTETTEWTNIGESVTETYTDTAAEPGEIYQYEVRCFTPDGAREISAYDDIEDKSIIRLAGVEEKLENTTNGVKVSWTKAEGASGYIVYRKSEGEGFEAIKKITSGDTISYTDTTPESGVRYTYMVRSTNGSTKSAGLTKTILYLKSTTPQLSVDSKGVNVSWTKVDGAKGYYIYRKTGSGGYVKIATIKKGSTVSYIDKTVADNPGTYTYAVKAYNGSYISKVIGTTISR